MAAMQVKSTTKPDTMDALKSYISDWARIIYDATGDQTKVDRAILLADLNGMFDPVKFVGHAQSPSRGELHDVIAKALDHSGLTYSGVKRAAEAVQKLYAAVSDTSTVWTASAQSPATQSQISALDDASNACLELAARHGFATGHGDTVADMIREFSAQIISPSTGGQ